jgi:hypothetical protein
MDEFVTTDDLIREAAESGHVVTSRQLERWRNEHILPGGTKRGLGQGAGTYWRYPASSVTRLLIFLEIRRPREPLSATAVRLWLRGHDMPLDHVRRHLTAALVMPQRIRRNVAELGPVAFGERFAEDARRKPASRKKHGVGKFDNAAHEFYVTAGETIALAFTNPSATLPSEGVASIATMMNPSANVLAVVAALGENFNHEVGTALPLVGTGDTVPAEASDEELLLGRTLFAGVAQIVALARALPESDVRRDFLMLIGGTDDEVFGFTCMLQAARGLKAQGITDTIERLETVRAGLPSLS